jgi:phosphatidate cytidylyltransferase
MTSRPRRGALKRLATAAVGVPLALAAVFLFPNALFFALSLAVIAWGAFEYLQLLRPHAPGSPLWLLLVFMPAAATAATWALLPGTAVSAVGIVLAGGLFLTFGLAALILASGAPEQEVPAALGIIGFGVPYFALPVAAVSTLQRVDPWLVLLLLAIVWLGDTAAYYVGSSFGRRKMAPRVSPNKSWEGAIAGFLTALLATVVWGYLRLEVLDPPLLAIAAVTAVAAQLGDLTESLFKRGVRVKDSGNLLPGHGGMFDRLDALLLAAPVFLAGLWLRGMAGVGT